ncbi:hypothetical protein [Streptomyces chartreusis]|uniref:hypothetical protein n=1 Tax=Streptomyces chartreusis TaxID=1969 RepID=UPI0033FE91C0
MPVWEEPAISNAGDQVAIEGHSTGTGVFGESANWRGLLGKCNGNDGFGVMGESGGSGVVGVSQGWHGVYGETNAHQPNGACALHGIAKGPGVGVYGRSTDGIGVVGKSNSVNQAQPAGRFEGWLDVTGRVYIGHKLDVKGDIYLGGTVHPNGTDYAESFDADETAAPGTVLVIGENGLLAPCDEEYDTAATGVVSGAGGLTPGSILAGETDASHHVTVALAGQVYVKADAGYGAITVGDLLTTSPTEGFAMRVADRTRAVGAIIGKALTAMPNGTGLVRMLVVNS